MIPKHEWQWYGMAGHFICGRWCRFHLCTKVGPWLVSTVGAYVHPRHSGGSEQKEAAWLKENWPGEDIGLDRKFETMVFRCGEPCSAEGCGCGQPMLDGGMELDSAAYNDIKSANEGHLAMCEKWSAITQEDYALAI